MTEVQHGREVAEVRQTLHGDDELSFTLRAVQALRGEGGAPGALDVTLRRLCRLEGELAGSRALTGRGPMASGFAWGIDALRDDAVQLAKLHRRDILEHGASDQIVADLHTLAGFNDEPHVDELTQVIRGNLQKCRAFQNRNPMERLPGGRGEFIEAGAEGQGQFRGVLLRVREALDQQRVAAGPFGDGARIGGCE
ncbi:MAG: hypothetical protein JHC84_03120 [Solirubrobacteraceae bacterium]|nr:hypothetical protein [Solirubrobacteraceae bacterium]